MPTLPSHFSWARQSGSINANKSPRAADAPALRAGQRLVLAPEQSVHLVLFVEPQPPRRSWSASDDLNRSCKTPSKTVNHRANPSKCYSEENYGGWGDLVKQANPRLPIVPAIDVIQQQPQTYPSWKPDADGIDDVTHGILSGLSSSLVLWEGPDDEAPRANLPFK